VKTTADLLRAREALRTFLGKFEETEPHAFDELFHLIDDAIDTAYEVGQNSVSVLRAR
jgi:hypothetical protein